MHRATRVALLPRAPIASSLGASGYAGRTLSTRLRQDLSTSCRPSLSPNRLLPGDARLLLPLLPRTPHRLISYKDLQSEKSADEDEKTKAPSKSQRRPDTKAQKSASQDAESPAEAGGELDEAERAYQSALAASLKAEKRQQARQKKEQEQAEREAAEGAETASEGGAAKEKSKPKEPEAPLHGNKSPWQVFSETLSTEFKASKDWNDGTKQLSGSINDFTQNPNVQKARSAYTKATGTAATASSAALKTTAGAIGSSASWAWETPVVRGLRSGTSAVGSGVEKATRPLRDTQAYKNLQDTIDDGSSTKYGGWVDKEERRKRREARELRQGKSRMPAPTENDPK